MWKEKGRETMQENAAGRNIQGKLINPPPINPCSCYNFNKGPLVGSFGISSLLNTIFPPVQPSSTLRVMV